MTGWRMTALPSGTLRYLLIGLSALSGVMLFLLATATANTALFAGYFPVLLWINAGLAAALGLIVLLLIARLIKRYRAKVFGTRLTVRLVMIFALIAVLPGTLVYVVSVSFLNKSIESWFDVKVDKALESGLTLAQVTLDSLQNELFTRGRIVALDLSDAPESAQGLLLQRVTEQFGVTEAALFTQSGGVVASAAGRLGSLLPDVPPAATLRQAATTRGVRMIDEQPALDGKGTTLRARVLVPVTARAGTSLTAEPRILQLIAPVPDALAKAAESVRQGNRDYQELVLARSGLRKIFAVTLTLVLVLALFAAIGAAILQSSRLSAPLEVLAEGTEAVAKGDFKPRAEFTSKDELGVLTQRFNRMTRQLGDARVSVEAKQRELQDAKSYLESILTNLTTGVIVFDPAFHVVTANQGATQILRVDSIADEAQQHARGTNGTLSPLFEAAWQAFQKSDHWQQQLELRRVLADGDETHQTLLLRGSRSPVFAGDGRIETADGGIGAVDGYLLVCDEITGLVSAQRAAAWGEVARRLAHEIKNPLTPIQLSAERMQMKLTGKLPTVEHDIMLRGTNTIINQVAAMKRMVDDFRDYARTPPAVLGTLDLNALIGEVMALYADEDSEHAEHAEHGLADIRVDLKPDLPSIRGDATQLRQVIHNLLQNAQDAAADESEPLVKVVTRTATLKAPNAGFSLAGKLPGVELVITDNGPGFAQKVISRAFEPYVTTKSKGTGLGLAIVKKIVDDHGAKIVLDNIERHGEIVGARVTITFAQEAALREGELGDRTAQLSLALDETTHGTKVAASVS